LRLGVLIALAIVLVAPAALATETEPETVSLVYRVPDGCPNESAFVSAVGARTRRAKFVDRAANARRFVVDVRRLGGSYSGRLVIEAGGERATRDVTSARCEDLVDAFVLFTAIAIDPGGAFASVEAAPPPASAEPAAPPASPPALPPPPPASPPPVPRRAPAAVERQPPARPSWHLSVGSGGIAATGIAESAMIAAHPVLDLAWSATGPSPSMRIGLVWANGASQPAPPGRLTFGLRALALSGCGYHLRFGESAGVGVRLCVVFEGGVLQIRPFALERPRSTDRPWFAAGPLVRLDVPILPGRLAAFADGAIAIPLERESVYVSPGPTVAAVEAVGLRLALGIVLQAF